MDNHLPLPTQAPFDAPFWCVSINYQWWPYIIGAVNVWKASLAFTGDTPAEDFLQRQHIYALEIMLMKANEEACANMDRIGEYVQSPCLMPFPRYIPCDGRSLLRVDYPILYERIDASYIVDADNFTLPTMANKTFIGAGEYVDYGDVDNERAVGESVGEAGYRITISDLPEHAHPIGIHTHSYTYPNPNGPDVQEYSSGTPIPMVQGGTQQTGAINLSTLTEGGGDPIDNTPPAEVAYFYIIAQ